MHEVSERGSKPEHSMGSYSPKANWHFHDVQDLWKSKVTWLVEKMLGLELLLVWLFL